MSTQTELVKRVKASRSVVGEMFMAGKFVAAQNMALYTAELRDGLLTDVENDALWEASFEYRTGQRWSL